MFFVLLLVVTNSNQAQLCGRAKHQRPQNSLSDRLERAVSLHRRAADCEPGEVCVSVTRSLVTRYLERLQVEAVSSGNEAAAAALLH